MPQKYENTRNDYMYIKGGLSHTIKTNYYDDLLNHNALIIG